MHFLHRTVSLSLACGALLWALPAWAQDAGNTAPDDGSAISLTADPATPSTGPTRFVQVQAGLGLSPAANSPVPFYYTELGASFEQTIWAPVGIRVGAEMDPSALNQWMTTASNAKTSFSGYSGDIDITMAAARATGEGPLPYIALGNRVTYVAPSSDAAPSTPSTWYSMNIILGVKIPGGLVIETRYPLYTSSVGINPLPAYFETQVGYWRGF